MRSFISVIVMTSLITINHAAIAHDVHYSMVSSIFGENLTHWLISHQGFIVLSVLMLALIGLTKFNQSRSIRFHSFGKKRD